jgi:hypothetical protein
MISKHRLFHRHRRLGLWLFGSDLTNCVERTMDIVDQLWKLVRCDSVVGDVR